MWYVWMKAEGLLPPRTSVEESVSAQRGENAMRHLITHCYIWKMGHSLTLATSQALHELILEAKQALQILFVITRAGWVHSGELSCLKSLQQRGAKCRIS